MNWLKPILAGLKTKTGWSAVVLMVLPFIRGWLDSVFSALSTATSQPAVDIQHLDAASTPWYLFVVAGALAYFMRLSNVKLENKIDALAGTGTAKAATKKKK